MIAIHEIGRSWPGAGYVLGGSGVSRRTAADARDPRLQRVSDAVDAADALVKRAELN